MNQIIIPYYFIIIYFLFILIPFQLNKSFNEVSIETIEADLFTRKNSTKTKFPGFHYKDYGKDNGIDEDKEEEINYEENEEKDGDKEIPKGNGKEDKDIPEKNDKWDYKEDPDKKDEGNKKGDPKEGDDDYRDWDWEPSDTLKNLSMYYFYLKKELDTLNNDITKNKIYIVFNAFITGVLFLIIVIYSSIKCFLLCTKRREQDYGLSYLTNKLGELYIDDIEEAKTKKEKKSKDYDAPSSVNKKNKKKKRSTFNPDNYKSSDEDKILYKPYKNEDIQ